MMFYLGQPYSHPDPAVREERYLAGCTLAARLALSGWVIYAPIPHWHVIAQKEKMPTDFAFWQRQCLSVLARCDLLIIYQLDGWAASKGLAAEREFAESRHIPTLDFKRFPNDEATAQLNTLTRGTGFPVAGRT